jgi:hybrid polyketide synthase/nonribosomal peptide synthetase FtdB
MERDNQTGTTYEQIAIVGIGCRFPGGIISPATFWEFLLRGEDGTSEVPDSRWSLERHYDAERGKGISPREAASMDPQQRLLLETTWEAFEDAGIPAAALARKKVGVFVGLFTHDYENLHMRTSERHLQSPHSATGMSPRFRPTGFPSPLISWDRP